MTLDTTHVPLELDEDNVLRVGGSRVPLDTVISAFMQGATPEQIAEQFPSLRLSDIYSTIGYYLDRRDEIDEYLSARAAHAKELRMKIESRRDIVSIRQRLIRRARREEQ